MKIASPAPLNPDLAHMDLATLQTRGHVSELVSRGVYGLRSGYTSLSAAVAHLEQLTAGDARTGAAIVQQGDRFYGVRVLEKISDPRVPSGLRGAWLRIERDENALIAPFNRHDSLRAVVDGHQVLYTEPAR